MRQALLEIQTRGRGLVEITGQVQHEVHQSGVHTGQCQVFIQHTSASLLIGENADPDVLRDLETFLSDLVPDGDPRYTHTAEGPDDMPAHVRCLLTQTALSLPVIGGQLGLGTWQGVFVWEHRHSPHLRRLVITTSGCADAPASSPA